MKPDKHKKEKSANYKKKHGITDASRQDGKTDGGNKPSRDMPTAQNRKGDFVNTPVTSGESNEKKQNMTLPSSYQEVDAETNSYQRRKVVSNWERYEVKEVEEPTLRGSDFAQLLKSSANVLSHYQYRDELGLIEEDSKPNTCTKLLTLDCDDLALSLMSVPLHQRLGIEESVFEPNVIQRCVELSKEHASKYVTFREESNNELSTNSTVSKGSDIENLAGRVDDSHTITDEETDTDLLSEILQTGSKQSQESHIEKQLPPAVVSMSMSDVPLPLVEKSDDLEAEDTLNPASKNGRSDEAIIHKQPEPDATDKQETSTTRHTAVTGKDTLEFGSKASTTQNKQTLRELENELDLLLSL